MSQEDMPSMTATDAYVDQTTHEVSLDKFYQNKNAKKKY